jgi:hypothetical protein
MSHDDVNDPDLDDGTGPDDAQLDELFRLVAQAFADGDPAPPVEEDGMSFSRWAAPDADLGVMFESELAGVRDDGGGGDDLEFIGGRYRITVGTSLDHIVGEVSPWSSESVLSLEFDGGPVDVDVDEHGEFYIGSPPGGPVRLRVESPAGAMVTEWFTINPSRNS